jgi:hypothetical protein
VSAHSVQGEPWPQVPGRTAFGKTGADGRFTLIGLGDDKFRVYAGGHPDDFIEASAPQPVAAGTRNVEFRLERGVTIAGRVLDRKGQVVRGMFVQAERHGSPVQVDREGRFAIHALKPGTMRLHGQIGDRIVDLGETQAPAEGLELTVKDD